MTGIAALPDAFRRFLQLYERGAYFEAHEALEAAWHRTRSDFYQGLIILAAAFCKRDRGNAHGIARNLQKARRYLRPYAGGHLGLDVDGLLAEIDRRLARLRAAGVDPRVGVTRDGHADAGALRALVEHLPLRPHRRWLRGDEPEIGEEGAGRAGRWRRRPPGPE